MKISSPILSEKACCVSLIIKIFSSLPGVKKALGKYGPANVEDTTGSGATDSKDDDDIDLFGSDDEEVWHVLM